MRHNWPKLDVAHSTLSVLCAIFATEDDIFLRTYI